MQRITKDKIVKFTEENQIKLGLVMQHQQETLLINNLIAPSPQIQTNEFTGKRELYQTNTIIQIHQNQINQIFNREDLETYQHGNGYLIRQTYNQGQLNPKLTSICLCNLPLNPDLPYSICQQCRNIFHQSCLIQVFLCPDCNRPFKRQRQEQEILSPTLINKNSIQTLPLDLQKYKSLSKESKSRMLQKIKVVLKQTADMENSMSSEDKTRHQLISKLMIALFLSQEENRVSGVQIPLSFHQIKVLAMEIQKSFFVSCNNKANTPEYKKKIRALSFNMIDQKNLDFRSDVLKKLILTEELVKMQSRDMASGTIKKFRQERQIKYQKQQLVLPKTEKVLIKNHKGDVLLGKFQDSVHTTKEIEKKDKLESSQDDPFDPDFYTQNDPLYSFIQDWLPQSIITKLHYRTTQFLPFDAKRLLVNINLNKNI